MSYRSRPDMTPEDFNQSLYMSSFKTQNRGDLAGDACACA